MTCTTCKYFEYIIHEAELAHDIQRLSVMRKLRDAHKRKVCVNRRGRRVRVITGATE